MALILILPFSCSGQVDRDKVLREPVVAGSFYPADAGTLRSELEKYFSGFESVETDPDIAALIAPHAGYVFSAPVAAAAYARLDPEHEYKRIFVIGTSHHVLLDGASVYCRGDYRTPLGTVPVDRELANRLISENRLFTFQEGAHRQEHSIEVQLPFLQYRLKKPFLLVPVVIGTQSAATCRKLAEILKPYFTPENLFVISSDFSHYPAYADAVINDRSTGLAIESNSPEKFMSTLSANETKHIPGLATSCCGWSSVLTLLDMTAKEKDIRVDHLSYMNSGDSPYGDKERVVGYHAFALTRVRPEHDEPSFTLRMEDKRILLTIAREAIEARLNGQSPPPVAEEGLSAELNQSCGAFVTLTINGSLRGCIGRFMSTDPLWEVVQQMAISSAFYDSRFSPVTRDEMKRIDIEISVLTPLKRIRSADEFRLGEQGIYMVKDGRSGTFLPQVAESTGWTKEEFLGHCARDKAGIGWDGWRDAELYTYEALVFDEKELKEQPK